MAEKIDIKAFRESVERGKKTAEEYASDGCPHDIKLVIDYDADNKPIYLESEVWLEGLTCASMVKFLRLSEREENPVAQFVAGVIGGCYDKKDGELIFNETDVPLLDRAVNGGEVITVFSKIMELTGLSEDSVNVEKPS